jgi:hypothetical protein
MDKPAKRIYLADPFNACRLFQRELMWVTCGFGATDENS